MYDLLGDPRESWPQVEKLTFWQELKPKKIHMNRLRGFINTFRRDISDQGIDLLNRFFDFNPDNRISAKEALLHPFFREQPLPLENSRLLDCFSRKQEYHEQAESLAPKRKMRSKISPEQDMFLENDSLPAPQIDRLKSVLVSNNPVISSNKNKLV